MMTSRLATSVHVTYRCDRSSLFKLYTMLCRSDKKDALLIWEKARNTI